MEFIELEKVYRRRDDRFLNILNEIRNNIATDNDISAINVRCMPEFQDDKGFYIHPNTNDLAGMINMQQLANIKEKEYIYHGYIEGDFDVKDLPTDIDITLKTGAEVILLNNDLMGRWINGSIGKVAGIKKNKRRA